MDRGIPVRRDVRSTVFPQLSIDDVERALRRDGIARGGFQLPAPMLAEIRAFADQAPRFGNLNRTWGFRAGERAIAEERAKTSFAVGHYFNLYSCPSIRALQEDPFFDELAKRYIGPHGRLLRTHMWWSYPNTSADAQRQFAQQFHFDLDDYRFFKLFFYITPVDQGAGPHVYVAGTHRNKAIRHKWPMRRLTDEDVHGEYPSPCFITLTGAAGEGFLEDTHGIHKGTPPTTGERLLLELEFASRDYGVVSDRFTDSELQMITG